MPWGEEHRPNPQTRVARLERELAAAKTTLDDTEVRIQVLEALHRGRQEGFANGHRAGVAEGWATGVDWGLVKGRAEAAAFVAAAETFFTEGQGNTANLFALQAALQTYQEALNSS